MTQTTQQELNARIMMLVKVSELFGDAGRYTFGRYSSDLLIAVASEDREEISEQMFILRTILMKLALAETSDMEKRDEALAFISEEERMKHRHEDPCHRTH